MAESSAKRSIIEPRTLKGFRDHLPADALAREWVLDVARRVYRGYGFAPIDTPALEYLEVLTGKGSEETDKQLYRFTDHGGREVGMRFDLTVPFARFAAAHVARLGLPFKRYHMASVWRGENTQRGRYREFVQCDFDTIGTTSGVADLETLLVVHDLFVALGVESFTIHVNDRRLLAGLLDELGLAARQTDVLRSLDKLAKAGREVVAAELTAQGVAAGAAERLLAMAALEGPSRELLAEAGSLAGGSAVAAEGLGSLAAVVEGVEAAGVPAGRLVVDCGIARGLDYYTGIVFETLLDELPSLGSVCSGGRYDNLAGLYTRQSLPGVGGSLGLDRLLAGLEELGRLPDRETPAEVFLVFFDESRLADYLRIAAAMRSAGLAVEFYPEPKKVGTQLKLASKRGHPLAVVIGPDEFASGTAQLKEMASGTSTTLVWQGDADRLAAVVRERITKLPSVER
jgi:histidyl-tRNA synthetase